MKILRFLLLILPSLAFGQGVSKNPPAIGKGSSVSGSSAPAADPAKNAVFFAPFNKPGCYASGTTSLATDGSGTPVAITYTRNDSKTFSDVPNRGWVVTCPANQLAVSGAWTGALFDAPNNNLLTAPTDSPTSSGAWSLVAAGPTVTANSAAYLDGTTTMSNFTEAAGVVSGLRQSYSFDGVHPYCAYMEFSPNQRPCWGLSFDGITTSAKFNIWSSGVTWCPTWPDCSSSSATVRAGSFHKGRGYNRAWACTTPAAGAKNVTWFATSTCDDNAIAATGATSTTAIGRAGLEYNGWITSYQTPGSVHAQETTSAPVTFTDGNICLGAWYEPSGGWINLTANLVSVYGSSGNTFASPNSAGLQYGATGPIFWVTDNAGAWKYASLPGGVNIPAGTGPRHVVGCVSSTGVIKVSVDGSVASVTSGSGTGILNPASLPNTIYIGQLAGSGGYAPNTSISLSDVIACGAGAGADPLNCGSNVRSTKAANLALGDSITDGPGVAQPWTYVAAAGSGANIAQNSRSGWSSTDCLRAYSANRNHRWRKVAVLCGTNDLDGATFERIRQIYVQIIQDGAIPVPMTILPRGLTGQYEIDRINLNKSIQRWGYDYGYPVLDSASCMDDPSNPGHLRASDDSGDGTHPNATGHARLGTCAIPYFQ
jgi:lysophospholipase L1-like esterase